MSSHIGRQSWKIRTTHRPTTSNQEPFIENGQSQYAQEQGTPHIYASSSLAPSVDTLDLPESDPLPWGLKNVGVSVVGKEYGSHSRAASGAGTAISPLSDKYGSLHSGTDTVNRPPLGQKCFTGM
jgi:hypothetical protein